MDSALYPPSRLFALLLVYAGLWLALTPYAGISHDAQAYAAQAMARLQPDIYAQDLFLRYRSQDEFSIFTALYAPAVATLGLERAAAALTLICHAGWMMFAFLIGRRLLGLPLALLSLGLIIVVPGDYGGLDVFHVAEPFLTARLPAEVLCLLAIWLMLVRRTLAAACVLVIALVIHPLMAFPVALLAALLWLQPRVPWRSTAVLAVTGILLAVGGAYFLGGSTPIMEGRWLLLARLRSAFLFIDQWQLGDWNCTFQTLFTLGLAAGVAQSRDARSLASATLWVASAGLLLAILCTFVNLYVLLQGQPWRWLWVARVVAILLLPGTLFALWRSGTTGRAAALLCGAGWTIMTPISMRSAPILMLGSVLAAASVIIWTLRTRIPRTSDVLLLRGAWAILVCGVLASLVTIRLGEQVRQADADNEPYIVILLTFVAPAIALAIAAWRLAVARGRWIPPLVLVAIGCTLIGTAWPDATDRWFGRKFSSSAAADFADWRKQIPTSAEVFWWEKLREIWFLLERRSYLTLSQETGMLFSEPLAEEVVRRALVLEPLVDTRFWINRAREDPDEPRNLTLPALIAVCQDPELGFVISEVDLGTDAPAKRWPNPEDRIYLYDCGDFREVSTHVPAAA